MKKLISIVFFFFFFGSISAQNIRGKVMNSYTGQPIPEVSILVADSLKTTTASDGSFTLAVHEFPVILKFSATGFETLGLTLRESQKEHLIYLFPESETLSEVVLRSTIIPRDVQSTPASVSIISVEDLERTDETSIVGALNSVAGVYVQQGALNTNKINIRGVGARAQYSSNRLKAYFMGIPLSSGEGETTLDDIDPAVVGQVEIVKGPASGIYGAGLGGVINLYPVENMAIGTKAGSETSFGSFELLRNTVNISHATQKGHFSGTYNNLRTDSFRDNGKYERNSITITGGVSLGETNELSVLAQVTRLKAFIPSSLSKEDFENQPSSAAFAWEAAQGYESYDKGLFGLSYAHEFSKSLSNTTSAYLKFRNGYEPRPFNILEEDRVAVGARTKFSLKNDIFELPSDIGFGGEVYNEWYENSIFENLYEENSGQGSLEGDVLSQNKQDRSYMNVFAQWNLTLSQKTELEAGLNLNSTRYELEDLFEEDQIDQSGEYRFKTVFSPRLGIACSVGQRKNLYAVISHGFSTPTVAETLTPEGLINTRLRPETGINYEMGFKGNFMNNRLYAEVAFYTIQVNNLLVAERVSEDQYIGRNLGKTDHNGVEFLLNHNFELSSKLTVRTFLNGSLNHFRFDDFTDEGNDFSGNKLPAVPNKSIHAGVDISSNSGISLFTSFQHEGAMPLNDENSSFTKSYELVNLKATYAPRLFANWKTEFFAGVNNVFEEQYAASIVPNAVGFGGAAPRYYYPGNPRNYFGGISLEYLF
ncbi:TonB-dependent receptor plug domain-containing protein [Salinimicrobium gaetbulicola]|uniref:TonB-dependent receptor plug domain-containing protein n=1 Tax=Salinimicrobium gaetbulicola TaxID=999702 RepID=A0ABW3IE86_9FLAO